MKSKTPHPVISRILPLLNLAGCLILTGIVIFQWLQERGLGQRVTGLTEQLATVRDQYDSEKSRTSVLESDIAQLKAATEATVKAREETEAALAKVTAEREAQAAATAAADQAASATTQLTLQTQTAVWEKAIAQRDAKISDLDTRLTATRERLDQAIAKLKQAAAR